VGAARVMHFVDNGRRRDIDIQPPDAFRTVFMLG
jgi:hypothetical protein